MKKLSLSRLSLDTLKVLHLGRKRAVLTLVLFLIPALGICDDWVPKVGENALGFYDLDNRFAPICVYGNVLKYKYEDDYQDTYYNKDQKVVLSQDKVETGKDYLRGREIPLDQNNVANISGCTKDGKICVGQKGAYRRGKFSLLQGKIIGIFPDDSVAFLSESSENFDKAMDDFDLSLWYSNFYSDCYKVGYKEISEIQSSCTIF